VTQAEAAEQLRALHHAPDLLVLPNAWDVTTARIVEQAGFPVVATSSAAVAGSLGYPDDDTMDPDAAFAAVRRIADAVAVPVTADLEGGYRLEPVELVQRLLDAGAVGCNLEDTDHHGPGVLVDVDVQAERLQAIRAASVAAGVEIVINARTDVFVRGVGEPAEQVDEMIRRGRRYLEAGADCVYPILVADADALRALVDGIGGSINVFLRREAPNLDELRAIGVARASLGSGLARTAHDAVRARLEALRDGQVA
jgi:2-methylisocitrate lyase-like PEP mutase family enzyme